MGIRRRLTLLIAFAVLAAGAAVGVALAHEPGSTANRGRALADARKRLRSFVPPPNSHRVHALPRSLHLNGPFSTIGSPRFIGVHAFWVSSEPVESVRAYLETHAPPGASHSLSGEEGGRSGTYRWDYGYEWPELANVADNREMLVGVVARPGGGSALRADAQATYVEPKPKGQQIPAGAGYLEAEEVLGKKTRVIGTASAAKIAATAKLIDGFPIVQDNGGIECGAIPSERVTLKGTFRASPGGPVLAETEQRLPAGYCDFIGLTVEGKEGRALFDENEGLVKALQNLLARKYKQPLLAGIEGF
jgi:hypothetical protein